MICRASGCCRYEAPREEDKKKPFSYVGFGGGRHGCMGTNFAYLQVSIPTLLSSSLLYAVIYLVLRHRPCPLRCLTILVGVFKMCRVQSKLMGARQEQRIQMSPTLAMGAKCKQVRRDVPPSRL